MLLTNLIYNTLTPITTNGEQVGTYIDTLYTCEFYGTHSDMFKIACALTNAMNAGNYITADILDIQYASDQGATGMHFSFVTQGNNGHVVIEAHDGELTVGVEYA